jgi:aminoglycoside phosphotransferase (APT) family kinase protein
VTSATAEVPSTVEELDGRWLTRVLGATVTGVRAEQIAVDSGFSSLLYRLHLTGDASLPGSVIAKLPAQSEARGAMEMMGGYARELAFYRYVAGRAPMGTPRVYAARMAADSTDFVLVLEDLWDWDNADHLAGLSLERVRLGIAALAGLHAWSTDPANADALRAFPSLDTEVTRGVLPAVFAQGWQVYREHARAPVTPVVARYAERFADHAAAAVRALTERSMLVHGDIRADNLFFSGDQLKVVDFQLAARGVGASDVAYLVSQGLPTALRAGRDEKLVRGYLESLGACGVDDYSFDDAWRHYRFAVAYLICLPVTALISWESLPERSRLLCLTLTERAAAAIDEIDALAVFG